MSECLSGHLLSPAAAILPPLATLRAGKALWRSALCAGLAAVSTLAAALAPPPNRQAFDQLRASGQLAERVEFARALGNNKLDPQSIPQLQHRLGVASGRVAANTPPPNWQGGLPTTGSPKVLVLMVDFSDAPADATNTPSLVAGRMFGAGGSTVSGYPTESLRAYYQRSSYGALNISGTVTNYYRAQNPRSYYQALGYPSGNNALIDEALTALQATGHTFGQYDNNGDGYFDTLFLKWTGSAGPWASFWWAYQGSYTGSKVLDGKRPRKVIWSWVYNNDFGDGSEYRPRVDIHEVGHALGLPDYYDYDGSVGPKGGVGGLDMMDGNWGDHNAFSKFVLGWLTPTVVSSGSLTKALQPSGTTGDAVLLMPGSSGGTFGEFFMAQYRKRSSGNDASYPTDGITLWHIDSTLNASGTDYLYNNSYTARKLIRLVQADGLGQIEAFDANADAGDFYTSSNSFTPSSNPNSKRYDGTATNASMTAIGAAGATMQATFSISTNEFGLNLSKSGTGGGTVSSNPGGIACGSICSANFANGTSVTLTASAASGSVFAGWSGACTGSAATCVVSMTQARNVTATFNLQAATISFAAAGYNIVENGGSVVLTVSRSSGAGTASVNYATSGGTATSGIDFQARSGTLSFAANELSKTISVPIQPDSVAEGSETFTVGLSAPVGANLGAISQSTVTIQDVSMLGLTVTRIGTGSGLVTSAPAGIQCGATCTSSFATGATVVLTAAADAGSTFAGWRGACTGTAPSCTVTMSLARTVTAVFNAVPLATLRFAPTGYSVFENAGPAVLTVTRSNGNGAASVSYATRSGTAIAGTDFVNKSGVVNFLAGETSKTISIALINDTLVETNKTFTVVLSNPVGAALSAAIQATVTLRSDDSVKRLTVAKTGQGTVSSLPAGSAINCGTTCTALYPTGVNVTIRATPAVGWVFSRWGGACLSVTTNQCTLPMSVARTATAVFVQQP